MNVIHENIKTMFRYRGYTDIEDTGDFITGIDSSGQMVYAFKEIYPNLNNENIKEILGTLKEIDDQPMKHGLVVYSGTITPAVNKAILPTASNINLKIEVFPQVDLSFICVHHDLVPPHHKLSQKDALEIRQNFSSMGTNGRMKLDIPCMASNDPISRFYNFQPGDIVRVDRKNELPAYRRVIARSNK